ncbi:MAG: glycoside hydrolase family 15 protein, partial [Planctomycetia bacterium]|nr:glycoside hydrolase family 15 protein [Planctomycetia bacterium]
MSMRIEDYAMIGDCRTAALVARDGSIDWLCAPRFDSGACFAALLGTPENGRWKVAPGPNVEVTSVRRRYRPGTLVLETEFTTASGAVRLTDAMAIDSTTPTVVRLVEGLRGEVPVRSELVIRFDYGWIVPWVRRHEWGTSAIAGPDMMRLRSWKEHRGQGMSTVAEFTVKEGQKVPFTLAWHPSTEAPPPGLDAVGAIRDAETWWRNWSHRCENLNGDREAVVRSLITLKALTYAPTGGIVAAATTSLPEKLGGVRNWDYRFCWLRDATFTLLALVGAGYLDEARAWRDWLLRAVAGRPEHIQIMYGVAGERRLTELELPWLSGYEGSKPVRLGNAASDQFQLDVYGEIFDALHQAERHGLAPIDDAWRMGRNLLEHLETAWKEPDEGIWEVRGPRRHFTHSKVMAWVAFDRAVKSVEQYAMPFDGLDRWRSTRDAIHAEVCARGFDPGQNAFVQSYGAKGLDASLLMIPLVGFLPADDPRMRGTVEAIQARLMDRGFVKRYDTAAEVDGLPPGEGVFLPCTFWLADNLAMLGRRDEAAEVLDRLLDIRNDVGLLAEEYDLDARRQLGNFPQAFSHVCLV